MTQLHEILAVEASKKGTAQRVIEETLSVFKKDTHFDGVSKTYKSSVEGGDSFPPETKEISTTVSDKLKHTSESVIPYIDVVLTKEETNSSGNAKSNLTVGSVNFGDFSATSLLALEKQLQELYKVYNAIPTLDPARQWKVDTTVKGQYVTDIETKFRTIKKTLPLVLYPATDKHPAQTQTINEEVQVGTWDTLYKSGKLSPANKAKMLDNINELLDAVKIARSRANKAEITSVKVGKTIFEFIEKI